MDDNGDDQIECMGSRPNDLTAPALRGIKNAFLRGHTLEVDRDAAIVLVINGVGQRGNTNQKGTILPPSDFAQKCGIAEDSIEWKPLDDCSDS